MKDDLRDRISLYLYNELEDGEREAFEAELEADPELARAVENEKRFLQTLSQRPQREAPQALLAEYQAKQREAANEAAGIVAQAREEAARLKQHAADDLTNALKLRERQAVDRIAQAEAKALADVRNMAVDLAMAASRDVLREQVGTGQSAQAQMIEQSLAELPKRLN